MPSSWVVFWIFVLLAVLFLVAALIILLAPRVVKRGKPRERLSTFALYTLIPCALTLLAGAVPAKLMTGRDLADLSESERIASLTRAAGHQQIAAITARCLLDSGLFYTDFTYDATLDYLEDPEWNEEERKSYFKVTASQGMIVHNPTSHSVAFPFKMRHYQLSLPASGNRNLSVSPIIYETMSATLRDEYGQQLGSTVRVDRDRLRDYIAGQKSGLRSVMVPESFDIGPQQSLDFRIVTSTYEPIAKGEIACMTQMKTVGMRASLTFPQSAFKELDRSCFFVHKRCYEGGGNEICKERVDDSRRRYEVEIIGGLLPFNGIIFGWKQRANTPSPENKGQP